VQTKGPLWELSGPYSVISCASEKPTSCFTGCSAYAARGRQPPSSDMNPAAAHRAIGTHFALVILSSYHLISHVVMCGMSIAV
jgi:hypothetical protein